MDFHHLSPADLPGAPQLNTWPVVSPVNASRRPSRDAAHHSGSGRMASPYPMGDFHLLFFASFLAHSELGSNSEVGARNRHVRFHPDSYQTADIAGGPFRGKRRHGRSAAYIRSSVYMEA